MMDTWHEIYDYEDEFPNNEEHPASQSFQEDVSDEVCTHIRLTSR